MRGRSKRMINCHDCSRKCRRLHQAISDHRLKSICLLLLSQSEAIKRELCLSGLIQLTGGDNNRKWMWLLTDYESYQCSPRRECIWQWMCDQHPFYCHHFHHRAVSLWKRSLFLLSVFVYCTGVVVLVSHSRCWKDLGEGFEKKHTECYSNQGSHKPLDPFGILVCTLWHRQAHIIYTLGYITQTNLSAHTTAKKATHAQDRLWSHNRALLF